VHGILCSIWRSSSKSCCTKFCFGNLFSQFLHVVFIYISSMEQLLMKYEFIISYQFPILFTNQFLSICAWILQRALALEDALSKGLPIQKEIESSQSYLEGVDKDSVLDLVLASLPEDTRNNGTDTQLQLKQKASCVIVCCWLFVTCSL
jgi:hypothetical protein